jgi:thiol-disulfide isomerase/thioredoxin
MNYLKFLPFLLLFVFTSCKGQDETQKAKAVSSVDKIEVIDFYGTHRCKTCKTIEANAKFTVETYFEEEMNTGKISFKTVNVDAEENAEIAERFEAVGTALFLNVIKGGKENHIDLTNFAFENAMDKEDFATGLKEKIREQLNTI